MLQNEFRVSNDSEYFIYTPSMVAHQMLFYPTIVGRSRYMPGYHLKRDNFSNYLFILVEEGSVQLHIKGRDYEAPTHSLILLDCYSSQEYGSTDGACVLWMHFDGSTSRQFYDHISQNLGIVSVPSDYEEIHHNLNTIYSLFREKQAVDENVTSRLIYDTLLRLISTNDVHTNTNSNIQRAILYVSEHFTEPISLQQLADVACLSPYYFTRSFRKETGMTPHQYILETRYRSAQFLLASTEQSVKEIALSTGFADESSFCASFRKRMGQTPSQYRAQVNREF